MSEVFKTIINHAYVTNKFNAGHPFQILLHNGDNDLACDHIEAEYFVENLKINKLIKVRYIASLNAILTLRHKMVETESRGELICRVDLKDKMLL